MFVGPDGGLTRRRTLPNRGCKMSTIEFRDAWRRSDPELERGAIEFWNSHPALLPATVSPQDRARDLCVVAYHKDRAAGVATAVLATIPQFRTRMAVFRCAVTIGLRHTPLSWQITEYSQSVLERWSLANPGEKVMGLMAVMQSRELVTRYPQVFGVANMTFVGFNEFGYPIRVAWFKHATIPTDWPPRPLQTP